MALQGDGSREECLPSRYDDPSATFLRATVYGFLNGFLVFSSRSRRLRVKLSDGIVLAANLGHGNALLYLLISLFVPFGRRKGRGQ